MYALGHSAGSFHTGPNIQLIFVMPRILPPLASFAVPPMVLYAVPLVAKNAKSAANGACNCTISSTSRHSRRFSIPLSPRRLPQRPAVVLVRTFPALFPVSCSRGQPQRLSIVFAHSFAAVLPVSCSRRQPQRLSIVFAHNFAAVLPVSCSRGQPQRLPVVFARSNATVFHNSLSISVLLISYGVKGSIGDAEMIDYHDDTKNAAAGSCGV